ncbi:hypothetical protein SPI_07966 [Niveomyces insectorum RCEF 264]|uniref:AA1-like domain-containing protein n=1 Tax=Niveomyces insectorum RCEF 264 TaxID=1081102 RepID=A0A162IFD9_9HYPO|nr:hypothetical protein SPI_07966 [Niveomyces insectorum RCEF 264]
MLFSGLFLLPVLAGPLGCVAAGSPWFGRQQMDVANCTSRSARMRNLTVYGVQILYTSPPPATRLPSNGTHSTNSSSSRDTSTSVVFQMYNAVLGVDAQCAAHVSPADGTSVHGAAANTWHTCFVESRDTRITAAFQFDLGPRHVLTVNETWICNDGHGVAVNGLKNTSSAATTATFQALGTNNLTTLCPETINITLGQHYCAEVPDLPLPVTVTRVA